MSAISRVEREGPQRPGEHWWAAYDVAGTCLVTFWTEERNPPELIDDAIAALDAELAEGSTYR